MGREPSIKSLILRQVTMKNNSLLERRGQPSAMRRLICHVFKILWPMERSTHYHGQADQTWTIRLLAAHRVIPLYSIHTAMSRSRLLPMRSLLLLRLAIIFFWSLAGLITMTFLNLIRRTTKTLWLGSGTCNTRLALRKIEHGVGRVKNYATASYGWNGLALFYIDTPIFRLW